MASVIMNDRDKYVRQLTEWTECTDIRDVMLICKSSATILNESDN